MKCPSTEELTREFRDLDSDQADLIVELASLIDEPHALQSCILLKHPKTQEDDKIDSLWRDGCRVLGIDAFIQDSSGFHFPIKDWCDSATGNRASAAFSKHLEALAIACRIPTE